MIHISNQILSRCKRLLTAKHRVEPNSLDKYTRLQTLFFKEGTLVSRFTHGAGNPFRRYFGLRLWQVGAMFQILSSKLYVCLAVCSYSRPSGRWHAVSNTNRMPRSPLLHLGVHPHLFLSGPRFTSSLSFRLLSRRITDDDVP